MRVVWGVALVLALAGALPAFAANPRPLDCPTVPGQKPWPRPGDVRILKGTEIYQPTQSKAVFVAGEGGYRPFELFAARQDMQVADNVPSGYYQRPRYGFLGRISCLYEYSYELKRNGTSTVSGRFIYSTDIVPAGFPRSLAVNCSIEERRCALEIYEIRGKNDAAAFLTVRFTEEFPEGEICLQGGWSGPPYPHPSIELYVDGVRMVHIAHESLSGLDGAVPCQGIGSATVLAAIKRAKRVDYKRVRQQGDRWYSDPNHDHEYMTEKSLKGLGELCDFATWMLKNTVLSDERYNAELKLRPAADALLQQPMPGAPPFKPKREVD